ncbi:RuBisCO large subunit C-terminal-like domain-containing protein [Rhodobacter ferrooxidans]|uniref:Ribulose-1,5-bisphosphate carboxylase/oxygenase large subunit n=1 Tax=Rhodobacter ferrooxidans TaxID=371731 RepID=C8S164_9RHOB|nr:RuBisCO large subunit C-terminal-like domain-containing protein [Rhodobacter sp. SW2]EEW25262.1 ribulose-1,5-bisphosphate carboxylase/oxygenase large subunit [Rhodobacter sp. SW2]
MRFSVTYRIAAANLAEARLRAEGIALEQTVEVPADVVPAGFIADQIVGQIVEIGAEAEGRYRATLSYSPESAGFEVAQLLNVIFGNSSIQRGIKVIGFAPGATLAARFPGPRFGIAGVRAACGRPEGGLIVPVLKPQGLGADALATLAYAFASAGADIVKDDHGLADQTSAPFRERVEKISAAVARANAETGGSTRYFANVAGKFDQIEGNLRFAADAGVGGLLVIPGLLGFGLVQRIAADASLNLPVMTHPAFLGSFVQAEDSGISHGVLFGTLQRLAGADISVFPNVGGRFGFTEAECLAIAKACRTPDGPGLPMFPSPGGGMSPDRAAAMRAMYGQDVAYLLGGSLLRHPDRIADTIAAMRRVLDTA